MLLETSVPETPCNKVAGLGPAILLKKVSGAGVFLWILRNFYTFFTEHYWWLLLWLKVLTLPKSADSPSVEFTMRWFARSNKLHKSSFFSLLKIYSKINCVNSIHFLWLIKDWCINLYKFLKKSNKWRSNLYYLKNQFIIHDYWHVLLELTLKTLGIRIPVSIGLHL